MKIDSSEISVVVQGPVFGTSADSPIKRYTYQSLISIRKYLPDAEVILSTWEGSDINDLPFDILVENEDPGILEVEINPMIKNTNRQILSTKSGIQKASRNYLLKLRSDTILEGNDFLKYYQLFPTKNRKLENFHQQGSELHNRISKSSKE